MDRELSLEELKNEINKAGAKQIESAIHHIYRVLNEGEDVETFVNTRMAKTPIRETKNAIYEDYFVNGVKVFSYVQKIEDLKVTTKIVWCV